MLGIKVAKLNVPTISCALLKKDAKYVFQKTFNEAITPASNATAAMAVNHPPGKGLLPPHLRTHAHTYIFKRE